MAALGNGYTLTPRSLGASHGQPAGSPPSVHVLLGSRRSLWQLLVHVDQATPLLRSYSGFQMIPSDVQTPSPMSLKVLFLGEWPGRSRHLRASGLPSVVINTVVWQLVKATTVCDGLSLLAAQSGGSEPLGCVRIMWKAGENTDHCLLPFTPPSPQVSDLVGLGRGPRFLISHMLTGDAHGPGLHMKQHELRTAVLKLSHTLGLPGKLPQTPCLVCNPYLLNQNLWG